MCCVSVRLGLVSGQCVEGRNASGPTAELAPSKRHDVTGRYIEEAGKQAWIIPGRVDPL